MHCQNQNQHHWQHVLAIAGTPTCPQHFLLGHTHLNTSQVNQKSIQLHSLHVENANMHVLSGLTQHCKT